MKSRYFGGWAERTPLQKILECFLLENGIEGMPQDIGPIECTNWTIIAMTKRMLEAQKLEESLQVEVVANAVYTLNQYPT